MESASEWLLETRLVTVFKVDNVMVFHHTSGDPYFQISVSGFVLDGWGEKVPADINLHADDGATPEVSELESVYSIGSIHRLDATLFGTLGGCFQFYNPETEPVSQIEYHALNKLFIRRNGLTPGIERTDLSKIVLSSIASLCERIDGSIVRINCNVTGLREITTKRGAVMASVTVSDVTGAIEITLFSDIYSEVSSMIKSGEPLIITGKLQLGDQGPTILLFGSECFVSILLSPLDT